MLAVTEFGLIVSDIFKLEYDQHCQFRKLRRMGTFEQSDINAKDVAGEAIDKEGAKVNEDGEAIKKCDR